MFKYICLEPWFDGSKKETTQKVVASFLHFSDAEIYCMIMNTKAVWIHNSFFKEGLIIYE